MASAYYNSGTDMSYVNHTIASNEEGAGVINASFCYNSMISQKYARFGVTCPGSYSTQIICSDRTKPFRIAATWYVTSLSASCTTTNINFDMNLYKNGTLIASSTAVSSTNILPNTNYEIIQISPSMLHQYGSGEYTVEIILNGSFIGDSPNYVGISWGNSWCKVKCINLLEKISKFKFPLAKFHHPWYNVHTCCIWRHENMIHPIAAAQFFYSYYYFFIQKR